MIAEMDSRIQGKSTQAGRAYFTSCFLSLLQLIKVKASSSLQVLGQLAVVLPEEELECSNKYRTTVCGSHRTAKKNTGAQELIRGSTKLSE